MKMKLVAGLILIAFTSVSFASLTSYNKSAAFTGDATAWQECNAKINKGGGDYFPWSVAKPFPWSDIQGVWRLKDGANPYYLKAKLIQTSAHRKILSLSVISEGNCAKPIAKGLGYVDYFEKNVVRAIMNDGTSKYQMRLASFDVRDLEIDTFTCGENVMVASIQPIGTFRNGGRMSFAGMVTEDSSENVMLKKTKEDISTVCRKLDK